MTTAALGCSVEADALLGDYLNHVAGLGLGRRSVRDRTRIAREFLSRHPDLVAWMALPAARRAAELQVSGAWPLACYAIGTGRVQLDVQLAGIKQLSGLGAAVETRDTAGFAALREAGNRLGWTSSWVETVLGECLAVVLAWHGGLVTDLTTRVIEEFDAALSTSPIPRSSRRAYRARLASLRQLLYEIRVIDTAPRRQVWARSLEQRFTDVMMTDPIRDTLLRYIRVRAAVLRPKSVESLVNDLLPFAEYLTAHHPQLTSFRELDRACIEGYLACNRTRGRREQPAATGAERTVSAAVAQSAVLVVTPHQLRHTWATELANAGMSLQALMALLGHITPQMTLRYATLASPTLRAAYDQAIGKMHRQFTLTPVGKPILPDKVGWLHSEMLKTRVAHGYCARHPTAGACPYANIYETCDNYITAPEFRGALTDQLTDVQTLKTDADKRGWTDEAARHDRVAHALTDHLQRLNH